MEGRREWRREGGGRGGSEPLRHMNCKELMALLMSPHELPASPSNTSLGGMKSLRRSHDLLDVPFPLPCWHSAEAIFTKVLTRLVWATGLKLQ